MQKVSLNRAYRQQETYSYRDLSGYTVKKSINVYLTKILDFVYSLAIDDIVRVSELFGSKSKNTVEAITHH